MIDREAARSAAESLLREALYTQDRYDGKRFGPHVDSGRELGGAFIFSVVGDPLASGAAIVVPKSGSPAHWAPPMESPSTYVEDVTAGRRSWSSEQRGPYSGVRYYGLFDDADPQRRIIGMGRRRPRGPITFDEVFTRQLTWVPTEYFEKYRLGHRDTEHVEVSPDEAAAFVQSIVKRVGGVGSD